MKIYALKDKLTNEFGPPFVSTTTADAIRKTCNLMYREKMTVRESSDYQLWYLCEVQSQDYGVKIETASHMVEWHADYSCFLDDKRNSDIKQGQVIAFPEVTE